MKKWVMSAGIVLIGIAAYVLTHRPHVQRPEPKAMDRDDNEVATESLSSRTEVIITSDSKHKPEPGAYREAIALFTDVLSQEMTLENLERLAAERKLALEKANKGHPRSGQRLEVSFAAPFPVQVVYDINAEGQKVFQAARMVFPQESNLNTLKQEVKTQVHEAIASESPESLIFVDNPQGQTLWLGRTDKGRIQLALELNVHPHEHGGP